MSHEFITLTKKAKDITGQRFGRLTALGPVGRDKGSGMIWFCQCDCGNTTTVVQGRLCANRTKSCGCLMKITSKQENGRISATHGMARTPLYNTWKQMIQRCSNPKNSGYANYGGRGIATCAEWRESFESFRDHVTQLPNCGKDGYSLDRINNGKNYEPGNVKWSTPTEQLRNTRVNILLTHNNKTQCVTAWAEELGINKNTLWDRLYRGWSTERALSILPRPINKTGNRR